jgi:hypothetical protein
MDQFYAAVEMKDRPELEGASFLCMYTHESLCAAPWFLFFQRLSVDITACSLYATGKPIAVGGNSMLCTANYEGNSAAPLLQRAFDSAFIILSSSSLLIISSQIRRPRCHARLRRQAGSSSSRAHHVTIT